MWWPANLVQVSLFRYGITRIFFFFLSFFFQFSPLLSKKLQIDPHTFYIFQLCSFHGPIGEFSENFFFVHLNF